MVRVFLWTFIGVLATAPSAQAFGGLFGRHTVSYCPAPVTVVCFPVYSFVPVHSTPVMPALPAGPGYAIPKPAPASKTSEPPLNSPGGPPVIRDTSFMRGTYADSKTCKVGFWNLSGHDVRLKVNGQAQRVPRDRAITLDLGRDFTWQIEGQAPQAVHVPADKGAHEIVLR